MVEAPSISKLREISGISQSYASMILTGDRTPSRPLAIHIFRKTGWRHESLAGLTDDKIAMLEEIEPWTAKREKAA
jgi:hypothetical protein